MLVNPDEGGFSVWKQMTSYTPVGEPALRRLLYKCDSATYDDIREAIASHREGNNICTLVLERSLDVEAPAEAAVEQEAEAAADVEG